MEAIIFILLVLLAGLGFYSYRKQEQLKNLLEFEKNASEFRESHSRLMKMQSEELTRLDKERKEQQEKHEKILEELRNTEYSEKLRISQLQNDRENKEKEVKEKLNKELSKLEEEFLEDKENIETVLKDLKDKQEKTTENLRKIAEEKDEQSFRKIVLTRDSQHDMKELQKIENSINNKEILRKLIYKTYVEAPMNNMFDRLNILTEPGIYMIKNELDGRTYVGQSVNVRNRLREHVKSAVGTSNIAHQAVHDAMRDEGIENFTFYLLDSVDREQLNEREKYWIDFYESNTWGYNKTKGGS